MKSNKRSCALIWLCIMLSMVFSVMVWLQEINIVDDVSERVELVYTHQERCGDKYRPLIPVNRTNLNTSERGAISRIKSFVLNDQNVEADCVSKLIDGTKAEIKTCIFNITDGSGGIRKVDTTDYWKWNILAELGQLLKDHPDAIFLDVGSHLGSFSMFTLALGHKVIAIDPLKTNLKLLSKSVRLSRKGYKIELLWNAVSNVYEDVRCQEMFTRPERTIEEEKHIGLSDTVNTSELSVKTILLDDVVDYFHLKNKTIFMKLALGGSEHLALSGAAKLFDNNNVCYVTIDLTFAKETCALPSIVKFMNMYGFVFFSDPKLTHSIDDDPWKVGTDGFFVKPHCRRQS